MAENSGIYIMGVGAANADLHGMSRRAVRLRDSNPGHMHVSVGGVTRNILENAARLGLDTKLISAVGDDPLGELILARSRAAGMDVSHVQRVENRASSTYITILEPSGEMFIALSDMSILETLSREYLEARRDLLAGAAAIVCDPSLPEETIDFLLTLTRDVPVCVDPVSTAYAEKIKPHIGRFHTVKPNRMELKVLSGIDPVDEASIRKGMEALLDRGCRRVFVTMGAEGCRYLDAEGRFLSKRLRPIQDMANATGAGDAFTAAAVYGLVKGLDAEETLSLALAAGSVAIRSAETVSPKMSVAALRETLAQDGIDGR
ncbi:MAG: MarR family transcriptional regulator [Clostridiales bacterium]|nr:MarR family transcriptional regulator [Clostridiales bacterium]